MSVLIKGMEMPKSCYLCPFCDYVSARCDAVKGNPYTPESRYEKRADFCPLIPVPPHGRLIDVDALDIYRREEQAWHDYEKNQDDDYLEGVKDGLHEAAKQLSIAPTIIPAEEPKEE